MSLPDDVLGLNARLLSRLAETQDFYVHTTQAWRVVQQIAHEGRPVGITETSSGRELPAPDLEPLAQRYVTVYLAESTFKGLSGILEDWIIGLSRLWLTAFPVQLGAAYGEAVERGRSQRREEIQIPLSDVLDAPDRDAILGGVAGRVVRELAYRRPDQWFRFLDNRVNLGCPDEGRRMALCEMKAARDVLEHNRGMVNRDYLDKTGAAARYGVGDLVQIDEAYLLGCFAMLREVIEEMTAAAIRKSSGTPPSRGPQQ
jgi:hypothetical protein